MSDTPKRAILLYLQLTFVFSVVVWDIDHLVWPSLHGFGLMIPAIMWCPALGAVVTCRMLGREFRSLTWRWPGNKCIALACLVPLGYASLAYGAVWAWRQAAICAVLGDFVSAMLSRRFASSLLPMVWNMILST
jgi:hypothetical protein